jgi:hypothetical protein
MGADSDLLVVKTTPPDDLMSLIMSVVGDVQYKFILLIFIMFIFISTDVFIFRVLDKFPGAVDMSTPTTRGTIIQGMFLVISCILIDISISNNII